MDFSALKAEIATDPAGLGYAGKTNAQIAAILNDRTLRTRERTVIETWEILDATARSDYDALSAADKQLYATLISAGTLNVKAANIRTILLGLFGAGTATRTSLAARQSESVSRAEELGLGAPHEGDVAAARAG